MKLFLNSALICCAVILSIPSSVLASDHDDGEIDVKGRSLNLTDLYVFREFDHNSGVGDNKDLIFIMNSNPRSVPQQQYYFSTQARYEFHVSRVGADKSTVPTASDDVKLRFTFGAPDSNDQQAMTVTAIRSGASDATATTVAAGTPILTTKIGGTAVNNSFTLGGSTLKVFAGLRQDPFFFDVRAFFNIRSSLASTGGTNHALVGSGFAAAAATAEDFTKGYNVNAIVVQVPIAFLQSATTDTVFDVWETISIPQ